MAATIIIGALIAAAVVFAVRYVGKKGTCAGCAEKGHCPGCASASAGAHTGKDDSSCCH